MTSATASIDQHPLLTPSQLSALSLSTSAWRFESWLSSFPLTKGTVVDYFKHSNFYDATCNNELAAIQSINESQTTDDLNSLLLSMRGVEFTLDARSTDQLFLIRKQWRYSATRSDLLALYYVIGREPETASEPLRGTIFPMPTLHSTLVCNLNSILYSIRDAFNEVQKGVMMTHHQGYRWKFEPTEEDREKAKQQQQQAMRSEKQQSIAVHPDSAAVNSALQSLGIR